MLIFHPLDIPYFTAEQSLLLYVTFFLLLTNLMLKCFLKKASVSSLGMANILIVALAQFNQWSFFQAFIVLILLNWKRKQRLLANLTYLYLTTSLCISLHNIGPEYFISDLFQAQVSSAFTRSLFSTYQNVDNVYLTLSEKPNGVFFNFHTSSYYDYSAVQCGTTSASSHVISASDRNIHSAYLQLKGPSATCTIVLIDIKADEYVGPYMIALPSKDRFVFLQGGDLGNTKALDELWQQILNEKEVDALVLGGDLVYDNGMTTCSMCWDRFFAKYGALCKKFGKLIPLILAVGNHDVGRAQNPRLLYNNQQGAKTPYYFQYFPQHTYNNSVPPLEARRTYFVHRLGNLRVITLDSYYYARPTEQWEFFQNLASNELTIVVHHNPIIPSPNNDDSKEYIRVLHKILNLATIVFEHHSHNYKRTLPIYLQIQGLSIIGQRSNRGPVYLGNGAMGVSSGKLVEHDLVEFKHNVHHYFRVQVDSKIEVKAISIEGEVIDSVTPVL